MRNPKQRPGSPWMPPGSSSKSAADELLQLMRHMTTPALDLSPLRLSCPHCQQHLECDPSYGGTEIQCPSCTGLLLAPHAMESTDAGGATSTLNLDFRRPELQGFEAFYLREIAPQMRSRQAQQKTARLWFGLAAPLGTLLTVGVAWWLFGTYGLTWWTFTIVGVMGAVTPILALERLWKLKSGVKAFLLLEVCRFFGFKYFEEVENVRFQEFDESGLLPPYDRRKLEDRFRGNPGGVDFDMFECTLEKEKTSTDSDGHRHNTYKKIYHGVLFRFAFPKRFKGRTLALKDAGSVGNFFKNLKVPGESIRLEDPRFERIFEVWGSDQIEARYLLTPTFMERIVELAQSIDSKRIEFCFVNNLLLISAHIKKNQFEGGGLFTSVLDERRVEELVAEICRVFDIINILQLTLKSRI